MILAREREAGVAVCVIHSIEIIYDKEKKSLSRWKYLLYFQSDRLVVEGSNDVSLTCSSVGHQGEITFDKVKRTPLLTLNER